MNSLPPNWSFSFHYFISLFSFWTLLSIALFSCSYRYFISFNCISDCFFYALISSAWAIFSISISSPNLSSPTSISLFYSNFNILFSSPSYFIFISHSLFINFSFLATISLHSLALFNSLSNTFPDYSKSIIYRNYSWFFFSVISIVSM